MPNLNNSQKDALSSLIDKNPCAKCRAARLPTCKCKLGGGGEDNDSNNKKHDANKKDQLAPGVPNFIPVDRSTAEIPLESSQLNSKKSEKYNVNVIQELVSKKLLTIEKNDKTGMLTIKCKPNFLSKNQNTEVNKFINTILDELNDFKLKHRIPGTHCFAKVCQDNQGNVISLTISMTNPKLYDAFIHQLSGKNLLFTAPTPKATENQTPKIHQEERALEKNSSLPSPFSGMNEFKPKGSR